jgi:hypothetical protein
MATGVFHLLKLVREADQPYAPLKAVSIATTQWSENVSLHEVENERQLKEDRSLFGSAINHGAQYARHRSDIGERSSLSIISDILLHLTRISPLGDSWRSPSTL